MSAHLYGFGDPCLPTRVATAPAGAQWVHEIKHDGYRLMVRRAPDGIRIKTRRGYDWSDRYPLIVAAERPTGDDPGRPTRSLWSGTTQQLLMVPVSFQLRIRSARFFECPFCHRYLSGASSRDRVIRQHVHVSPD
jgi:hypothetical protein